MADPWAINASAGAPSYTAAELRRLDAPLTQPQSSNRFGAIQGVRPGGGVITSLSGSTITVQAHAGVISPDLTTTQGAYRYQLPTSETHSLTAAHLTLARTDLVTMRVDDHDEDGSGARTATSAYVEGTAGAGVPSLPARSFEIARIAVPASGGGSPSLTERNRFSVAAGGILPVRDAADLPSYHYEGRAAAQLDTDRLMVSDGSAWQRAGWYSVAGRTGCRLYEAVQNILNATSGQAVTWDDTTDQDTDGFISAPWDTITIPIPGLYAITFRVEGPFTTGRAYLQLEVTSTLTNMPSDFRMPMEPAEDRGLLSVTVPFLAGDSFQTEIYHTTGSAQNFECWLSAYRIGP